jgi:hypothetical protein
MALGGTGVAATAPVAPVASAAVSGVVVTVACGASPERLTIRNNRSRSITITKVGSTYQPRSGEPYSVNKVLGPGKSITYRFGSGRGANKLTGSFIFNDTSPREKGKVWVSGLGTVTDRC